MNEVINHEHPEKTHQAAIDIFIKEQTVSISLLQRRMKIGYSIALRIMAKLEHSGVVTEPDAMGLRTLTPSYSIKTNSDA
ncbi:DNA translocase FtsK [Aquipseudomonas alcaligenes]|uniref:FtsK gamma domain-containing protein n=1 Tax=Aquipseudomonas alcaligenes TaxID=43263 RepID=A0AA37CJ20_AQUAC|nr:DNA translocase FtsK [Pseudomonas alcaligenes]MDH1057409.1 hypothetical protein [Pseudomonas alcaligenes]BCR23998.1 hypothetical protein KAM426_15250 [Pseudomonas alcaligenes]GIZ69063.1 hypothetical protein KAM428_41480 [Pseudomonas alcaligenes]GIZ73384.1 hypothetical protein KAM429_41450 [Pseudomonas alcaligenes]GIZ77771.1 hypothetical protein KAM430_41800 [Pseudomonas alcaligenes]